MGPPSNHYFDHHGFFSHHLHWFFLKFFYVFIVHNIINSIHVNNVSNDYIIIYGVIFKYVTFLCHIDFDFHTGDPIHVDQLFHRFLHLE